MENFIYSLMYPEKKKLNLNTQIKKLEEDINKLVHVKAHVKTIDLDARRIDVEFKIEKINIGFSRLIEFKELKELEKLEDKLKKQITTIILMYYNLK